MSEDIDELEEFSDDLEVEYLEDNEMDNLEDDFGDIEEIESMEPTEDKSILTFTGHVKPVFCVKLNSDSSLAITGGQDDVAYVWNVKTGQKILECTGHKDSVTYANFNHDDKYVVTADMSGLLQVWDLVNSKLIWCYEEEEMEWTIWHHSANVILSGVRTGDIYMFQIPSGKLKILPNNNSKCTCGILLPDGILLAASYENGNIDLWDLKLTKVVAHVSTSDGPIINLALNLTGKLLMAWGHTGCYLFKSNNLQLITKLEEDIETAAFCDDPNLSIVATGDLKGDLTIWDIHHQLLRHKINLGQGITMIKFANECVLLAACIDGVIYAYDGRSGQLLQLITGHSMIILDLEISKDKKFLYTTSDDSTCKVYDLPAILGVTNC